MKTQTPEPQSATVASPQPRTFVGSMWRQAYYEAARGRLARALCAAGEAALERQIREQRDRIAELRNAAREATTEQQAQWLAEVQKLFVTGVAHVLAIDDPRMIEPAIRPLLPPVDDALAMAARDTGQVTEPELAEVGVRTAMTAVVDVLPSLIEQDDPLMEARGA